jgi:hypothetical protein
LSRGLHAGESQQAKRAERKKFDLHIV